MKWRIVLPAIVAATVVAVAATVWLLASRNGAGVTTQSIDGGALVSSDGRTVSVTVGTNCNQTNTLTASEQQAVVTVAVQVRVSGPPCSGFPGAAVYSARLRAPLGHRSLVDGATGRPVPIFDGRRILRPAYLPPGYALRYDAPDAFYLLGSQYLAVPQDPTVSCSQLYAAHGFQDLLVITQASGGTLHWPPDFVPRAVTVRGHRALAVSGRVSWTQDGQTIVVAATDQALPASELIAVADSLA